MVLVCGRGVKFFHPWEAPILQQHTVTHFWCNTLTGITEAAAVDLLRLNSPRGTKPALLTSKSYDEHLSPFLTKCSQNGSIFRCLFKREIFNFLYTNCCASSFTVMGNPYCQAPTLIWRKINVCSLLVQCYKFHFLMTVHYYYLPSQDS